MPARTTLALEWVPAPGLVANAYFTVVEALQRLEEPIQEIIELFASELDMNFFMEGRPTKWEALSEKTIKNKILEQIDSDTKGELRRGEFDPQAAADMFAYISKDFKILQRTTELYQKASSPEAWSVRSSGNEVVAWLADYPSYGDFHVEGTKFMPARDWTYISEEAQQEAEQILFDFVTEGWEG